jgi:hypothetical protein
MWDFEHTITTPATPKALWRRYRDVATWPSWDHGNELTTLDGGFTAGARGTMTFRGQDPLPFVLVAVDPERFFADETDLGGFVIRFEHELRPGDAGTELTHRVRISGPAADQVGPDLGPKITAGVPDTMANLAALALADERAG